MSTRGRWRCWCPCTSAGGKAAPCWGFGESPELLGWWGSCWQRGMRMGSTGSEGCPCSSAVGCFQCFPTRALLVDVLPGVCLRLCSLFSQVFISACNAASCSYLLFFQAYKQLSRFTNGFPGLHAALPLKPRGLCVGSSLLWAGAALRCPLGAGDGVPRRKLAELGALQGQLGKIP